MLNWCQEHDLVAMSSSTLEDFLKPAQLMGKASSMIHQTLFYIAIEPFAVLNLVYGKNLLRNATMPSRSNRITARLFFAELSQMGRYIYILIPSICLFFFLVNTLAQSLDYFFFSFFFLIGKIRLLLL